MKDDLVWALKALALVVWSVLMMWLGIYLYIRFLTAR